MALSKPWYTEKGASVKIKRIIGYVEFKIEVSVSWNSQERKINRDYLHRDIDEFFYPFVGDSAVQNCEYLADELISMLHGKFPHSKVGVSVSAKRLDSGDWTGAYVGFETIL